MLDLYEPGGGEVLGAYTVPASAGTPSDAVSFEAWNSPGSPGAETLTEIAIHVYERRAGETTWTQSREITMARMLEIRAVGVVGASVEQVTDWTPVGQGRPFLVDPIPGDSGRLLEVRLNPPGGQRTDAVELRLVARAAAPSVAIASGLHASGLRGIPTGIGDGTATYIAAGGEIAATEPASGSIQVSEILAVIAGARQVAVAQLVELDEMAFDGALAAGESYLATVSYGLAGVTVTRSVKGVFPQSPDARPAVPVGDRLLGWVERKFGDDVTAIESAPALGAFAAVSAADSLNIRISPGSAVLDDRLIRRDTETILSLTASAPFAVYLLPAGTFGTVPSDPRGMLLFRGECDAGGIASIEDVRPYLRTRGGRLTFILAGVLAVDAVSGVVVFDGDADGIPSLLWLGLASAGAGTGGETVVDLERWDGAAWSSFFASDVARRPAIDHAASVLSAKATPETVVLSPGDRLRAKVVEVPTGGAAPGGATLALTYEVP